MTYRTDLRLAVTALFLFYAFSATVNAQGNRKFERVLIETTKPYDRVVAGLRSKGGRVIYQYRYVDGIAAEIPVDALEEVRELLGPTTMTKDVNVPAPHVAFPAQNLRARGQQSGQVVTSSTRSQRSISPSALAAYSRSQPQIRSLNNAGTRIEALHAEGWTGRGVLVAVIDTGIRPDFLRPDFLLADSVIGGKDFVGDGRGFMHPENSGHGTFVAGLISGSAEFDLTGSPLLDAIKKHAPAALIPGTNRLPIIGTAPAAQIYAVRVFGTSGPAGANLSVILASIEHVIDLREDHNRGRRGGRKIDVANLSIGVPTLYAGRTLLDRLVDKMLDVGIVPVVSGGNTGPSMLTFASPGSSLSAVTVGGTSHAANDRILNELIEPGSGLDWRPSEATQTASFSSRGPTTDGRTVPHMVVSGLGNIGQGLCPDQVALACSANISIASGTSFSAPIVAGIAAVLRQVHPRASATEIRNALVNTARMRTVSGRLLIGDGSSEIDRGQGIPDAVAASNLLNSGRVSDRLPHEPRGNKDVADNVKRATNMRVRSGSWSERLKNLRPGQRADVLYQIDPGTERVVVRISDIVPALPLEEQNVFFGDEAFVSIHSAKTSSIGGAGDYLDFQYLVDDHEFSFQYPDTGILRITVLGDVINAGAISATVTVYSVPEAVSRVTLRGFLRDEETKTFSFEVPPGTRTADFLLTWGDDWGNYPTSDMDLVLVAPNASTEIRNGATLAGPERVHIEKPPAGKWQLSLDGFDIPAGTDRFELRLMLDGNIVKGKDLKEIK